MELRLHPSGTCTKRDAERNAVSFAALRQECLPHLANIYNRCGRHRILEAVPTITID